MAEEHKHEGEIKPGTPKLHEDKIVFDGAHHPKMADTQSKLEEAIKAHGNEHEAVVAARKEVHKLEADLIKAQSKHLKELGHEKIPGDPEKVKNAVDAFRKEAKAFSAFGIARAESWGTAIKNNFSTGKRGFASGAIILPGVVMSLDAFRGQKKGPDGQPVDRGWGVRILEEAAGLALIGTGLLRGRRP